MACAAYRAGAAISSNLATGSTDAMHADRRLFLLAASDLEGRPLNYFIDACANALVEAQRAARYLIYLARVQGRGHVALQTGVAEPLQGAAALLDALGAGRRSCFPRPFARVDGVDLAAQRHRRDPSPVRRSHLHTNAVAARAASVVVHESKESVGKGRRARCAAVERSCEQEGRSSSGITMN